VSIGASTSAVKTDQEVRAPDTADGLLKHHDACVTKVLKAAGKRVANAKQRRDVGISQTVGALLALASLTGGA
jgi:hypothetical protein